MNETYIINISTNKSAEITNTEDRVTVTIRNADHTIKGSAKLKEVKNGTV